MSEGNHVRRLRTVARQCFNWALRAALLVIVPVARCQAQPEPPQWHGRLVWDDFSYASTADLTDPSSWCAYAGNDLPTDAGECEHETSRAWYLTNWAESPRPASGGLVSAGRGDDDFLRFNLRADSIYAWGRTPVIVSGFTRRTGTWYARLRLQDFSGWSPGTSTSFWTQSPYWACADVTPGAPCGGADEKYWSEWNFEWTTIWNVHRGTVGPWMSTGAVADGEGSAIGSFKLRAEAGATDFTCHDPTGAVELSWNECRKYFINGRAAPDADGPYVDALVRFDGSVAHWEVRAYANGADLPHPWVQASATSTLIGRGQPVLTIFSVTPRMGLEIEHARWFMVDRFLYTTEADKSLSDLLAATSWLQAIGIDRMNSLEQPLERPAYAARLALETRSDGLSPGEFLALPPQNYNTYYDLFWTYRVTNDADVGGRPVYARGWEQLDDHSLRVNVTDVTEYRFSEVRVRYRLHADKNGTHKGPLRMRESDTRCVASVDHGRTFRPCQ